MRLILLLPSVRWFVAHEDAWYRLEAAADIDLLGSVLALETVDAYELIEQPHQRGSVRATLAERAAATSGQVPTVQLVFHDLGGEPLESVRLNLDDNLLMHVEWLVPPYRDGWAQADARLRVEGVARLTLRVYLPPLAARLRHTDGTGRSNGKTLTIENLDTGAQRQAMLARDAETDITLIDEPFTGRRTLRLHCEAERISGSTDARQLGFLLVGEQREAA